MEESDLIPEKKQTDDELSNNNLTAKTSEEEKSRVLDNSVESQTNNKSNSLSDKKDTLFRRVIENGFDGITTCLLYTSPSPRDRVRSRMPSSA